MERTAQLQAPQNAQPSPTHAPKWLIKHEPGATHPLWSGGMMDPTKGPHLIFRAPEGMSELPFRASITHPSMMFMPGAVRNIPPPRPPLPVPRPDMTKPRAEAVDDGQFATLGSKRAYGIGQWLVNNYEIADGHSVPRQSVFEHYEESCRLLGQDPINNATFGKLIRAVFPSLKTRRLGTRGHSKYHYYGIRRRATPKVDAAGGQAGHQQDRQIAAGPRPDPPKSSVLGPQPGAPQPNPQPSLPPGKEHNRANPVPLPDKPMPSGPARPMPHHSLLGPFPAINPLILAPHVDLSHAGQLLCSYREHSMMLVDMAAHHQFAQMRDAMLLYWRACPGRYQQALSCAHVAETMGNCDRVLYKGMLRALIPCVLQPLPAGANKAIRMFARELEGILAEGLDSIHAPLLRTVKQTECKIFVRVLMRQTSLNHLSSAARGLLSQPHTSQSMSEDWARIDFGNLASQAAALCNCPKESLEPVGREIEFLLQPETTVEMWAEFVRRTATKILGPENSSQQSVGRRARQLQLKWSFVSSLVLRDLTLRSSPSFGAFHLLRLFMEEVLAVTLEEKAPTTTQESEALATALGPDFSTLADLSLPHSPPHLLVSASESFTGMAPAPSPFVGDLLPFVDIDSSIFFDGMFSHHETSKRPHLPGTPPAPQKKFRPDGAFRPENTAFTARCS